MSSYERRFSWAPQTSPSSREKRRHDFYSGDATDNGSSHTDPETGSSWGHRYISSDIPKIGAGPNYRHSTGENELLKLLPSSWSCSEQDDTFIEFEDKECCNIVCAKYSSSSARASLVLANKPIPLKQLRRLEEKGHNTSSAPSESFHYRRSIDADVSPDHSLDGGQVANMYPVITNGALDNPSTNIHRSSTLPQGKTIKPHVYYFEIEISSGMSWVGLVPAESVLSADQIRTLSQRTNDNQEQTISSGTSASHPFAPILDKVPGLTRNSIGLGSDGRLLASGYVVTQDGRCVRVSESRHERSWTDAFPDGSTIGCAVEVGGTNHVFFTRNGTIVHGHHIRGFDVKSESILFPAVGIRCGGTIVKGNFGSAGTAGAPFKWTGDGKYHIVTAPLPFLSKGIPSPYRRHQSEDAIRTQQRHPIPSLENFKADTTATKEIPKEAEEEEEEEEEDMDQALQKSLAQNEPSNTEAIQLLSPSEIDDAMAIARELCSVSSANAHPGYVAHLVDLCRTKQQEVKITLEQAMKFDSVDLQPLIDLNDFLLDALKSTDGADMKSGSDGSNTPTNGSEDSSPRPKSTTPNNPSGPSDLDTEHHQRLDPRTPSPEVASLVRKKDVFSLICLLRGQNDKRLEAAWALMTFANDEDDTQLRDEIRSSGGMHSLLTLFKSSRTHFDLKLVTALAVAYLLSSFTDPAGLSVGNLGLRVTECLRFLVNSNLSSSRYGITGQEIHITAARALTFLWINVLQPILSTTNENAVVSINSGQKESSLQRQSSRPIVHFRRTGRRGRRGEQRQQMFEVQELVETTVSLVVTIAESDLHGEDSESKRELRFTTAVTVETMCGVERARPIAVREGILKVLVRWLDSKDDELIRPAANALRDLTSPHDEYMAGWIHSQIVNEGALPAIVKLSGSEQSEVRLAVAQILSSLSVAPHTRAAIIDANGLSHLVQSLFNASVANRWDEPLALAAGSALLRLAAGAMTNATASENMALGDAVSPDKRDGVINDIIQRGAIDPFVAMAKSEDCGKLRLLSVQALSVISEDVGPSRSTRQKLCEAGAAQAFGKVLRQDVSTLYETIQMTGPNDGRSHQPEAMRRRNKASSEDALHELYHALHALANILEPVTPQEESIPLGSGIKSPGSQDTLVQVCMQTAESGGVDSLLWMASLPIATSQLPQLGKVTIVDPNELLILSCRSLASLCPLLLSDRAAKLGYAKWAGDVLLALTGVLKRKVTMDDSDEVEMIRELQLDALRGLCSLSSYEPLKIRIIDESLPQLLQFKNVRSDLSELAQFAQASNQVCAALGLTEDEVDVQLAGNDPKLLADWFSFERSMLLQAMARDEMRSYLCRIWVRAIRSIREENGGEDFPLLHPTSQRMATIDESDSANHPTLRRADSESSRAENDLGQLKWLFTNLANDDDTAHTRGRLLEQYGYIYENHLGAVRAARSQTDPLHVRVTLPLSRSSSYGVASSSRNKWEGQSPPADYRLYPEIVNRSVNEIPAPSELRRDASEFGLDPDEEHQGLLGMYPCAVIGTMSEKEWILAHRNEEQMPDLNKNNLNLSCCSLPARVQHLLDMYFPSRLLQRAVIPLNELCPEHTFNFRALPMPPRRYFSFRREGQMLSRVCEKHAASVDSEDTFWTLSFSNSTFAGEFAETLVQTLYRCPIIQAMSFASEGRRSRRSSSTEAESDEGSIQLANLAASLPPWVRTLTFDSVLSKNGLDALVAILKTMGQISAEQPAQARPHIPSGQAHKLGAVTTKQGGFHGIAIRNSPLIGSTNFIPFFNLLGFGSATLNPPPLLSLRILDLSGNNLGDEVVATILSIVHRESSGSSLERLDVSGNKVEAGLYVSKVLRNYAQKHRKSQLSGLDISGKEWSSSLSWLSLASNDLDDGPAALEIIDLLKNDVLGLKSLDLSNNALSGGDSNFHKILTNSLMRNTRLSELNLSGNQFDHSLVESILQGVSHVDSSSRLSFLHLDENNPPLDANQVADLNKCLDIGRSRALRQHFEGSLGGTKAKKEDGEKDDGLSNLHHSDSSLFDKGLPLMKNDLDGMDMANKTSRPHRSRSENQVETLKQTSSFPKKFESDQVETESKRRKERRGSVLGNMITVLFSAPLVWRDSENRYQPIEMLDFELERELLWQCFKEASMNVELCFDNATTDRLQAAMTKSCACLHFSGHGHPHFLTFEDGKGGLHWLGVDQLKGVITNGVKGGGAPFQFVFVSACHSGLAGETFVNAGVPHVVCCQQEAQLMDHAALSFTRAFYLALLIGRTVKDSFEIGRQAVNVSPNVPNAAEEMKKFVLLPDDGDHDVPVFDAERIPEWPMPTEKSPTLLSNKRGAYRRQKSMFLGSARDFEAPDQPLPTPPQFFMGRETDMYTVLNAVLSRRFVSLIGMTGIGRSSLASAMCHYINDRKNTMIAVERIFYVRARQARGRNRMGSVIFPLHKQLVSAGLVTDDVAREYREGADLEDVAQSIFKALSRLKALVVFDRVESIEGSEEEQEFPLFLSSLFRETKNVRVLMTARKALGLSSLGERVYELGPLNFKSTVRLFAMLCQHVHTGEDRRRLLELFVTDEEQGLCCFANENISDRTKTVLGILGEGVPARTFDIAYQMTKEKYAELVTLGQEGSEEGA